MRGTDGDRDSDGRDALASDSGDRRAVGRTFSVEETNRRDDDVGSGPDLAWREDGQDAGRQEAGRWIHVRRRQQIAAENETYRRARRKTGLSRSKVVPEDYARILGWVQRLEVDGGPITPEVYASITQTGSVRARSVLAGKLPPYCYELRLLELELGLVAPLSADIMVRVKHE